MKSKTLLIAISILMIVMSLNAQINDSIVDTRDGKAYKIVTIGTQTWLAENMAYKRNSGCWAYNNDPKTVAVYGYLYDGSTAKSVCPSGWHLPSDAEWKTLIKYLGGDSVAGGKMKESGTNHWKSSISHASNKSLFTGLPGGSRSVNGKMENLGVAGYWWCSSPLGAVVASNCSLYNDLNIAEIYPATIRWGISVRCIKN